MQNDSIKKLSKRNITKSPKEKNASRSLFVRRAIEDHFENRRLDTMIGNSYWGNM
ncbi:PA3496 family putative envelope integrity protein [Aestuariirhabdus sp. LZHN29]|uniref:PA3496 family putative envelope integrity protein n=1 Tax=Aestuariirhabdus sp. LZHN29 TaxID=3417462 RepID=UPI003CEDB850